MGDTDFKWGAGHTAPSRAKALIDGLGLSFMHLLRAAFPLIAQHITIRTLHLGLINIIGQFQCNEHCQWPTSKTSGEDPFKPKHC